MSRSGSSLPPNGTNRPGSCYLLFYAVVYVPYRWYGIIFVRIGFEHNPTLHVTREELDKFGQIVG